MLKAYQISGETMDGNCCELVFAESANKARNLFRYTGSLCSLEYTDISAKRVKEADGFSYLQKGGIVPFGGNVELFRNVLNWHEFDKDLCSTCGLSDYDQEKYMVCEGCDQCGECGCSCCKTCGEYACDCLDKTVAVKELLIDKEDDYSRNADNVTGLIELIKKAEDHVSAAYISVV